MKRWLLLLLVGAASSCSLVLDPNDLGAGCPPGATLCRGVCEPEADAPESGPPCRECGADELVQDGECVPYTTCREGEYESRAPSALRDRECRALRTCEPGERVDAEPTATSDRECSPCPAGSFSTEANSATCEEWRECGEDEHESLAPSSTRDRACALCAEGSSTNPEDECRALRTCEPGERVDAEPTATSDRECSPCPAGSFSTEANSATCEEWRECGEDEHESLAPSSTRDRACALCPKGSSTNPEDVRECIEQPAPQKSVVELRVQTVDDLAFLEVNGILHPIGVAGQAEASGWRDVSEWFWGGENQVRLLAMNDYGPQQLELELRLDGDLAFEWNCEVDACTPRWEGGVFVDQDISLPDLVLPPARTVTINGNEAGALYLNDSYTGLSPPAMLRLPVGTYRLGLGVAVDLPSAYDGSFYEETIEVDRQDFEVTLADEPPIGAQSTARIAILPIRRARNMEFEGTAVLTDAEIGRFHSQFVATHDQWLQPFSYRLHSWDITLLPTEEEIEMVSATFKSFPDSACDVLTRPKYAGIRSKYDIVIIHMSNYDRELDRSVGLDTAGMGDRCGQIQNGTSARADFGAPLPAILNILLHAYEGHQRTVLGRYGGLNGANGASTHGFQYWGSQGEPEWTEWYRYLIRGQVPERVGQNPNAQLSAPVTAPDFYVGLFSSFRHGLWLAP